MKKNSIAKYLQIASLLVVILCVALFGIGYAKEAAEITAEISAPQWVDSDSNPEEAVTGYIYQTLGWERMIPAKKLQPGMRGVTGYASLTDQEKILYNALKTEIVKVAAGTRESTQFTFAMQDVFLNPGYTAAELGVESLLEKKDGETVISETASDAFGEIYFSSVRKVMNALLVDCPYELYWFDKTKSHGLATGLSITYESTGTTEKLYLNQFDTATVTVNYPVAQDYAVVEGNILYLYKFNTARGLEVQSAAANAQKIVANNAGLNDYHKLCSYKAAICSLTDYNFDAVENKPPYGDPWQLIYVFDGNPDTKVVCEGYSKAFQYLCDLSQFTANDTKAISVTGTMAGGTGSGGHMWNVVTLGGLRYLADITNSDSGSAGQNGELFLAGYNTYSANENKYTYLAGTQTITYIYDDSTLTNFAQDSHAELNVSNTPYATIDASGQFFNSYVSWRLYDKGLLSVSGTGDIPDFTDMTRENVPWYEHRSKITSVVIEDGITGIGAYAFSSCDLVTSVLLPDSLATIGEYAFSGCRRLGSVTIPNSVTTIGDYAFEQCEYLTAATIPASVTSIGGNVFHGCRSLADIWFGGTRAEWESLNVDVPEGATVHCADDGVQDACGDNLTWSYDETTGILTISGTGAMDDYTAENPAPWDDLADEIRVIRIDSGVTAIGDNAFTNCAGLEDVYFTGTGEAWNAVEKGAGNDALTAEKVHCLTASGTCGEQVTWELWDNGELKISGTGAMADYHYPAKTPWDDYKASITSAVVENGVTRIGESAFSNCSQLTSVDLPNSLTTIGDFAFNNAPITSITIPTGVTGIGRYAFSGCQQLTGVVIPDGVTTIGQRAFVDCTGLESISIPASVTDIGQGAFGRCTKVTALDFAGNDNYTVENGVLYNKDKTLILCCPAGKTGEFTIPATVTGIANDAFYGCEKLTGIVIPDGVTSIGSYAFNDCVGLTGLELPGGITSIEMYTFNCCSGLRSIVIPDGVTSIGTYAFDMCDSLATATIPASVTTIGSNAFPSGTTIITPCTADSVVAWAQRGRYTLTVVHNWNEPAYTWAEDNSTCTATRTCANAEHPETETATSAMTTTATCGAGGTSTYTAAFENEAFTAQTKTVNVPALGHAWGETTYTWADDNSTCTATRTCTRDNCSGTETETVNATSEVTKDPTCTAKGETTYTATFTNTAFETQTKTAEISALGHTPGTAVQENRVESTCTAAGSYDEVIKCVTCGHVISREKKMLPLAAHTPEHHEAVQHSCYEDGNKEYWQCTACGKYFQDEQATNEITQAQTVDPARHTLDYRAAQASSCTWQGNVEHWICTVCKTCFSDQAGTQIIADVKLPALNHPDTEIRMGARTEPTCFAPGGYYQYIYCNTCQNIIDSTWIVLDPLGHDFGDPVYVWSADHSTCTATRTCTRDNCTGKETQEGTVSSKQTKEPTCTEKGETTYTAVFENTAFETQTETVSNIDALGHDLVHHDAKAPTCTEVGWDAYDTCSRCDYNTYKGKTALGHEWGAPIYDWTGYTKCTATRVCTHDASHVYTEDAVITSEVTKPATCEEEGTRTYTAAFTNSAFETQTTTGPIEAIGHSYGEQTYKWSADHSTCTATRTCTRDNCSGTETETVNATSAVTKDPSCTEKGETTYSAVFVNTAFETQRKTVEDVDALGHDLVHHDAKAPTCTEVGWDAYDTCSRCDYNTYKGKTALGHRWSEPVYGWADDYSQATADSSCTRTGCTETMTETVVPTAEITRAATCEGKGETTYTAAFTKEPFTTKTTAVEDIPALGHSWTGQIKYIWSADYSTVTAAEACERDESHTRNAETVGTTAVVTKGATCSAQGQTTYTSADFQNPLYTVQTKTVTNIPVKPHTEVKDAAVAATCTTPGKTEGKHCSVCGKVLTAQQTVPAQGHKLTAHARIAPTYEKTGTEAYWECTSCHKLFSNSAATKEISAPVVIAKLTPVEPPEPADKVEAFVTRCYRVILGREPDAGGLAYWVESLKSGKEKASEIINGFVTSNEFVNRHYSDDTAVEILYKAMLGRGSDAGGKNYWLSILSGGNPFAAVINGFCTSTEFKNLCAAYGIEPGSVKTDPLKPPKPVKDMTKIRAFVTRCYKVILSRTPDDTGLEYWAKALANGDEEAAGIIDGFVNSHEYTNKHLGYADSVEVLYNAMLGRGSDEGGKAYWVEQLQNGRPFAAIINGFCTSKEFKALCEQYGISPGSVKGVDKVGGVIATGPDVGAIAVKHLNEEKVRAFIARVYRVLLEREATEDEIVFWAGSVLTDRMTVAKALHDIVLSREFADRVPDNRELVRRLYQAYTGRNPGEGEADAWIARLEAGEPLENIANGFAASKEFKNIVNSMME